MHGCRQPGSVGLPAAQGFQSMTGYPRAAPLADHPCSYSLDAPLWAALAQLSTFSEFHAYLLQLQASRAACAVGNVLLSLPPQCCLACLRLGPLHCIHFSRPQLGHPPLSCPTHSAGMWLPWGGGSDVQ